MTQKNVPTSYNSDSANTDSAAPMQVEFLTPEQRLELVADILATMTLQAMRKHHENKSTDSR